MYEYQKSKKDETPDHPVFTLKDKATLLLPDKIVTQINYLHGKVGKTEWSGMLLYSIKHGSIAEPEKLVIRAEHIFLMDIGTSSYTEYEPDGDIVDLYDNVEGAMEMKVGHIHTHHSMSAFFSKTDTDELQSNVDKHNYYLSLIVNFEANYVAKIAFLSDVKTSSNLSYVDDAGKKKAFKNAHNSKSMVIIEMKIFYEHDDDFFYKRLTQVREKITEKSKTYGEYGDYAGYNGFGIPKSRQHRQLSLPSRKEIDADPKDMTDFELERLSRNVVSVTPDLSENRSLYTLLQKLAESKEEDLEFYYEYLSKNLEEIFTEFFDQTLDFDELVIVGNDLIGSIKRFAGIPKIYEIVNNICVVINDYVKFFGEQPEEDDDLDKEVKEIENVIT